MVSASNLSLPRRSEEIFKILTLTDFSEGDGVKDLTGAAEEAILSGWLGKVSRSRAPAGAGGWPHVPYQTCASLP
jgi:hypothetical protein